VKIEDKDIIMESYQVPPVCLGEKFKLSIKIENQGKVAIPQGQLILNETDYYHRTLCETTVINPKNKKNPLLLKF